MDHATNSKNTVFFVEAQSWEEQALVDLCSHDCEVFSDPRPIQGIPDDELPHDVVVLSPFIQSRVDSEQIDRLGSRVRLVSTRSTGYDHIDIEACSVRGIIVANVPSYGEISVAEHCFALLLALSRKVCSAAQRTVRGDFSIGGLRGHELHGKTLGVVGTGAIARNVLRIAGGFGMRRLAYDIHPLPDLAGDLGFEYVGFEQLITESDILSLHVPHNRYTHHMVDAEALRKCRRGLMIVNTARGGLIDTPALIDCLKSGQVGGAALDVIEGEGVIGEEMQILSESYDIDTLRRVVQSHALLRLPNVIITPHVGFNTAESVRRIIETTTRNIHAFLEGEPKNLVHIPVLK